MTTENEATRDLSTLLDLGTYQGMTDAEIELVLQHRIEIEARRRVLEANELRAQADRSDALASALETSRRAQDVLESMLNKYKEGD